MMPAFVRGPSTKARQSRQPMSQSDNPKLDADRRSNIEKDSSERVSGYEPMTGAQASYLKTLAEQAHELDAFSTSLRKAEASRRIDALKAKLSLQDGPPHTL
jgi:hypothetical protein